MTINKSKRTVLKGSAALIGAAAVAPQEWSKPVLNRLVTPAHAQAVSVGAGVYSFETGENDVLLSFFWPGGSGPDEIQVFEGTEASGDPLFDGTSSTLVLAASQPAGYELFEGVIPPPPQGLNFWVEASDYAEAVRLLEERYP